MTESESVRSYIVSQKVFDMILVELFTNYHPQYKYLQDFFQLSVGL